LLTKFVTEIRVERVFQYDQDMTPRKQRLTITVDPELVAAGNRAVETGMADSISGWVSLALAEQVRRDQRLESLRAAIADYEAEFGEITADEVAAQLRKDREEAVVVRGRPSKPPAGAARSGRRIRTP
jgi:glycerol dehydrogenase-like iron-containing ADH family enzyme